MNQRIMSWLARNPAVKGYHVPDSRLATLKGWPDWVFLAEGGILYRECKGHDDTVSVDQRRIGRLLQVNGADWSTWWSKDVGIGGRAWRELDALAVMPGNVDRETAARIAGYPDIR